MDLRPSPIHILLKGQLTLRVDLKKHATTKYMEFQPFMEQIHEHILFWMMFLLSNYANSDAIAN